jgi:hypothetical protein
MSKDPHIDETIEQLRLLAMSQDEALKTAKEIIDLKNQLIKLCEKETALYKRECKRLMTVVFWLTVLLTISSAIHIVNIFI